MSRIISGRFGGLYILNPKHQIRPTTAKVKEYIFNVLQNLEGRYVIDLFCGTGALGIEAYSRNAKHITFVDKHPRSIQLTRENLSKIKADPDDWLCVKTNALSYFDRTKKTYDIILVDPPYDLPLNAEFFTQCREHLNSEGLVVLEYSSRVKPDFGTWEAETIKKMGDTCVYFLRK
ncbi:MAG: RsmD family RNA methyltransferase [Candidatus Neomarinimicrobiota bacterium]